MTAGLIAALRSERRGVKHRPDSSGSLIGGRDALRCQRGVIEFVSASCVRPVVQIAGASIAEVRAERANHVTAGFVDSPGGGGVRA
ncbi:hypothetical protein ACQP1G_24785 [Nocardia sp. CA-107356]|uniref:hypothetical protein n=1 Tax=Nocardia sp. CA-107356 TaxID=3239972 RepID=UPI003D8BC73E